MSLYLDVNNLLGEYQSGFWRNHSALSTLLNVPHDLDRVLDRSLLSILILLNFSKAFDSISHDLLCHKLKGIFGFSKVSEKLIHYFVLDISLPTCQIW